jgi:cytochrome c-type biogenesis protein CcmH/NrfG
MEHNEPTVKSWSRTRICTLTVICLLAGIGIGYLARAHFQANTVTLQAESPAVAHASDIRIPSDPLKLEADKQAEPLLALLQKSPDDPVLLAEIGKIYYQMRRFPVAAKYYEDSVRCKPDAVVLVKLGGAYHYAGEDEKAIGAWNHALRLDPDNPDALFNIGYVKWHAQGNAKGAVAAWQELLKTNPNHPKRAQVEELIAQAKRHAEIPMSAKE